MATAVKRLLSGSTDGERISVSATGSPGTTIHTAVSGTTPGTVDEMWVDAHNIDTTIHTLVIQFGGTAAKDAITEAIPPQAGLKIVIPGNPLQNSKVVRAYADAADKITLGGYANAITD